MSEVNREVTVIYCSDDDLALYQKKHSFEVNDYGDMVIPQILKKVKLLLLYVMGISKF